MTDELRELAADLGRVPPTMISRTRQALEVTARNIKDDWAYNLNQDSGNRLTGTGSSVDYDINTGAAPLGMAAMGGVTVEAEIGPNLGKGRGPMAGWFESGNVDGVPRTEPGDKALKGNVTDFYKGLENAAADAIRDAL